jgi:hypothetical protein
MEVPLLDWKVKVFAPLLNDQQITHGNIRNDTESVNRVSTLTRCDAIATANYRLQGSAMASCDIRGKKRNGGRR